MVDNFVEEFLAQPDVALLSRRVGVPPELGPVGKVAVYPAILDLCPYRSRQRCKRISVSSDCELGRTTPSRINTDAPHKVGKRLP